MNKTILFSDGPPKDDKNKVILIIVILFTVIFVSLIALFYIHTIMPKNKKDSSFDIILWRNAIIKNDIKLEDIYQKETNKDVILNPIVGII